MALNTKQEMFIQEYLVDYNATQAAIRARYSKKTARQQGSRLLSNVGIRGEIAALKKERLEALGVTQESVLHDLAFLRDACLRLDENGKPVDATNGNRALEKLGEYVGLWRKESFGDEGVTYVVKRHLPDVVEGELAKQDQSNVVRLE